MQISRFPVTPGKPPPKGLMEIEHKVLTFKAYLPAGVTSEGGWREKDIVQFYTENGGLRTIYAEDIVIM